MLKFLRWLFSTGAPKRATVPNELDLQVALERGCAIHRQLSDGSSYSIEPNIGRNRQQQQQPQQHQQQRAPHPHGPRHGGPRPNGHDPNHRPGAKPN